KLDRTLFRRHLDAVLNVDLRVTITIDDGGESAYTTVAPLLEQRRIRGHFFIATDFVGAPGFLTADQIRELRKRGHVIGTHSCSHPPRISHCSSVQLHDEWERSCSFLSDVLGEPIRTGSVPGGYYSRRVANAAVRAGVRMLFTSEPTVRVNHAGDCAIFG